MRLVIILGCVSIAASQITIGVLTLPSSTRNDIDYVPASYINWVQAAGAVAVPIPSGVRWNKSTALWKLEPYTTWSIETYSRVFQSINGLVLPGGNPWSQVGSPTVKYLLELAVKANSNGDYFPVWGTCAGFETLMILTAGGCQANETDGNIPTGPCGDAGPITQGFDAMNASWPLNLTADAAGSRLFSNMPASLLDAVQHEPITMNDHHGGVDIATFHSTSNLTKAFRVLSTNVDRNGSVFVSTVEGTTLPFYGVQWHPEKNTFEWGARDGLPYQSINHSANAIDLAHHFSRFFVGEARKSKHVFASFSDAMSSSIYNYLPTSYDPLHPRFTRSYFIDWWAKKSSADLIV